MSSISNLHLEKVVFFEHLDCFYTFITATEEGEIKIWLLVVKIRDFSNIKQEYVFNIEKFSNYPNSSDSYISFYILSNKRLIS